MAGPNPVHTYRHPGVCNVTLMIGNNVREKLKAFYYL